MELVQRVGENQVTMNRAAFANASARQARRNTNLNAPGSARVSRAGLGALAETNFHPAVLTADLHRFLGIADHFNRISPG